MTVINYPTFLASFESLPEVKSGQVSKDQVTFIYHIHDNQALENKKTMKECIDAADTLSARTNKYLANLKSYAPSQYLFVYDEQKVDDNEVGWYFLIDLHADFQINNIPASTVMTGSMSLLFKKYLAVFKGLTSKDVKNDLLIKSLGSILLSLNEKETFIGYSNKTIENKQGATTILPFVYVSRENYKNAYQRGESTPIQWTHSWEVIGHWRKVAGVGKNQVGERVEEGRTWVSNCIKGCGDLVKKVRVIS